jgi:hypothetical protein
VSLMKSPKCKGAVTTGPADPHDVLSTPSSETWSQGRAKIKSRICVTESENCALPDMDCRPTRKPDSVADGRRYGQVIG